jgi:hypothetical protein
MDIRLLAEVEPWEWPGDAGATLLRALTDEETAADERLLAAELAGDTTVINDEMAAALLAIAGRSDAPDDLRCQAAISLGPSLEYEDTVDREFDDDELLSEDVIREIQNTLQRLHGDEGAPLDVRRRALEASIRLPQEWHRKAILDAYNSDQEAWRLSAVFAMRWVRGFEAQILEALDSPDPAVQYEAVCAAGNWELEAAWVRVAGLLESEDTEKELLLAAIEAAAWIRPGEAPELLYPLTDSEDEDVAASAHEAIAMAAASEGGEEEEEEDDL